MTEQTEGKTKLFKVIAVLVIVVIGLLILLLRKDTVKDGLYLVYACTENDKCYTLRADVTNGEGGVAIQKLYFNNGGYVYLDCYLDHGFCYELDERTAMEQENGRDWSITLIEKVGEK